jgi:hypothetical protein
MASPAAPRRGGSSRQRARLVHARRAVATLAITSPPPRPRPPRRPHLAPRMGMPPSHGSCPRTGHIGPAQPYRVAALRRLRGQRKPGDGPRRTRGGRSAVPRDLSRHKSLEKSDAQAGQAYAHGARDRLDDGSDRDGVALRAARARAPTARIVDTGRAVSVHGRRAPRAHPCGYPRAIREASRPTARAGLHERGLSGRARSDCSRRNWEQDLREASRPPLPPRRPRAGPSRAGRSWPLPCREADGVAPSPGRVTARRVLMVSAISHFARWRRAITSARRRAASGHGLHEGRQRRGPGCETDSRQMTHRASPGRARRSRHPTSAGPLAARDERRTGPPTPAEGPPPGGLFTPTANDAPRPWAAKRRGGLRRRRRSPADGRAVADTVRPRAPSAGDPSSHALRPRRVAARHPAHRRRRRPRRSPPP